MSKPQNKVIRQLSTKMLPNGRVRTASIITSHGHKVQNEAVDEMLRGEIPFKKWKKKEIKAVFTDAYIAALFKRADANKKIRGMNPFEIGYTGR